MSEFAFVDFETRSPVDLKKAGAYKYAKHPDTDASVSAFVIGDGQEFAWSPWHYWPFEPSEQCKKHLHDLHEHVRNGGYIVAWNAFFDRHIWNDVMVPKYDWPEAPLEQWLCAQAQAEANCLPGQLDKACKALGTQIKKDPKGKSLIKLLCTGTRDDWNPEWETAEHMGHFRKYGLYDVLSMRDVWQCTRPLTQQEWTEYHASETINDNGVGVDVEFARAAKDYATAEFEDINGELAKLTGDSKLTVSAHLRKAAWLYDKLDPAEELQKATLKPGKKKDDPPRKSCDQPTREFVLDALSDDTYSAMFHEKQRAEITQFLELIEAGNSAATRKFTAIGNQELLGRVHGQYSFNGAGQTGRFSSRGIQIHNLIRDPVAKGDANRAIDAIESILDGRPAEQLARDFGYPISRLLARLIRPTFIAGEGRTLVWADYDQIEARVLPWLSNSRGGEKKLDLYRAGEDVYKHNARDTFNKPIDLITEYERQVGKVEELSLLFGGAIGALISMARNYGIVLTTERAWEIVNTWRDNNTWCVNYWHQLWKAALNAYNAPGAWFPAGRVKYLFHPKLMRGTLICQLPDGRFIVYPQFKHEYKKYEDKEGNEREGWRTTFLKGIGSGAFRKDLWYGTLAENITQGTAASVLRLALVPLSKQGCVLHTHDEIVLEVEEKAEAYYQSFLETSMLKVPPCYDGLPLSVEVESGPFYTK